MTEEEIEVCRQIAIMQEIISGLVVCELAPKYKNMTDSERMDTYMELLDRCNKLIAGIHY